MKRKNKSEEGIKKFLKPVGKTPKNDSNEQNPELRYEFAFV